MIDTQGRKGQDARGGVIQFLLHCLSRYCVALIPNIPHRCYISNKLHPSIHGGWSFYTS